MSWRQGWDAAPIVVLLVVLLILAQSCAEPSPEPRPTPIPATATPTATASPTPRLGHADAPDLVARSEGRPLKIITPTPTATPTVAPGRVVAWRFQYPNPGTVEAWRELVASIFPAETVEAVLRVMACESGGNPNATGAAGERGLMQIHPAYHADATYDPAGNLRAAYRISNGGRSWWAWTCKP